MDEIGAALANHDAVGVGIGLHGRDRVREPFQRQVYRDGAHILPLCIFDGLAVGGYHFFRVDVLYIVVEERLRPAGMVEQLGQLVPVHIEILVLVVSFLCHQNVSIVVVGVG